MKHKNVSRRTQNGTDNASPGPSVIKRTAIASAIETSPLSQTPPRLSVPADVAPIDASPPPTENGSSHPIFPIHEAPVLSGPQGILYDFNYGCRVKVSGGGWRVRIRDEEAGVVLFDEDACDSIISSTKKYWVRFKLEVLRDRELVFEHSFDPRGKTVYFRLPEGTLGDSIAWFPYVDAFRRKHGCHVVLSMAPGIWSLFEHAYPELEYIEAKDEAARRKGFYASYYLGIFFPCADRSHQPTDFRVSGLQKTIPFLLGLPPTELRPRIALRSDAARRIAQPYVCIATHASAQSKHWNHPLGWIKTVEHLRSLGYRVLCVDKQQVNGYGLLWNAIPNGAEDFTGDLPLLERAELIKHADFFVGLSSGLSWLAWAVGTPVVMISGFTHPFNEFETPYRVINFHACNSCWNDTTVEFDHKDYMWCPRHKGTDRQFECSRLITPAQVCAVIDRLIEEYCLRAPAPDRTSAAVTALEVAREHLVAQPPADR